LAGAPVVGDRITTVYGAFALGVFLVLGGAVDRRIGTLSVDGQDVASLLALEVILVGGGAGDGTLRQGLLVEMDRHQARGGDAAGSPDGLGSQAGSERGPSAGTGVGATGT